MKNLIFLILYKLFPVFAIVSNISSCSTSEHKHRDSVSQIKTVIPNGCSIMERVRDVDTSPGLAPKFNNNADGSLTIIRKSRITDFDAPNYETHYKSLEENILTVIKAFRKKSNINASDVLLSDLLRYTNQSSHSRPQYDKR